MNDASRPIVESVADPVIAIHDLVKTFGATRALDGLDLSVAAGGGARVALTLTAIAVAILGAAWWRFRERDIR